MKTIVTTALSIFTLAVFFQVQSIAEGEDTPIEAVPSPTQPELWNVWGEAELEGMTWTVQPVACETEAPAAICVEVAMHNPTFNVTTATQTVSIWSNNNEPMGRMPSMPSFVDSKDVTLQAAGGQTVRTVLTLAVPSVGAFNQVELKLGSDASDPWSGVTVAAFSDPSLMGFGFLDVEADELTQNIVLE